MILAGATAYRDDQHRSPEFTKHPATWLNGDCWLDELTTAPPPVIEPEIHVAPEISEPEEGWADAIAAVRPDFKKAADG